MLLRAIERDARSTRQVTTADIEPCTHEAPSRRPSCKTPATSSDNVPDSPCNKDAGSGYRLADIIVQFAEQLRSDWLVARGQKKSSDKAGVLVYGRSPRQIVNALSAPHYLPPVTPRKPSVGTVKRSGMRFNRLPPRISKVSWRRRRANQPRAYPRDQNVPEEATVKAPVTFDIPIDAENGSVESDGADDDASLASSRPQTTVYAPSLCSRRVTICLEHDTDPHFRVCSLARSCQTQIRRSRKEALFDNSNRVPSAHGERQSGTEYSFLSEGGAAPMINLSTWSPSLARKIADMYNMEVDVICDLWVLFAKYAHDSVEYEELVLTMHRFQLLVLGLIKGSFESMRDIPPEIFSLSRRGKGGITFLDFLDWFSTHCFSEYMVLSGLQRKMRGLARTYNVNLLDAEHVFREFDKIDVDGNFSISFTEFCNVLRRLLKIGPSTDFPDSRLRAFWADLHSGPEEEASIDEFFVWYLKYFLYADSNTTPVVQFYRSLRQPLGVVD